jgi:uncharacterized protein involved in propanediol utilization
LQGVTEDESKGLHRVLVSLPCGLFQSRASFSVGRTNELAVDPPWKRKALRAAKLTLERCAGSRLGGRIEIQSNIPIRWGLGSSTADVTAVIRTVANTCDCNLVADEIADLSVKAEHASDSTMFEECVVVFAHRDGIVLERLNRKLPPLEVVGFNTDSTQIGVDTLDFSPARYTWHEIESFRPLLGLLRRAVVLQDSVLLGRVASASARINQRFLPKPNFDQIERIVERVGAIGLQVAHSGTVAALLFEPRSPGLDERIACNRALLRELGILNTWRFRTQIE